MYLRFFSARFNLKIFMMFVLRYHLYQPYKYRGSCAYYLPATPLAKRYCRKDSDDVRITAKISTILMSLVTSGSYIPLWQFSSIRFLADSLDSTSKERHPQRPAPSQQHRGFKELDFRMFADEPRWKSMEKSMGHFVRKPINIVQTQFSSRVKGSSFPTEIEVFGCFLNVRCKENLLATLHCAGFCQHDSWAIPAALVDQLHLISFEDLLYVFVPVDIFLQLINIRSTSQFTLGG